MSDVRIGAPGPRRTRTKYADLVDAAFENLGEWVSVECDDPNNASFGVRSTVASRVADFSQREGRLWLRIKT